MKTSADTRKEVEGFWDNKPCDSDRSDEAYGTTAYFKEIEVDRYKYQGHILDIIDSIDWKGKKVLEIGTGVGTDARIIIGKGADYTGINIDQGSVDLTSKALHTFSLPGKVEKCDATAMKYADGSFDIVYSFGAMPCIPDLDKAIGEINRILKPGGEVLGLLYNKSSINYHVEIMFLRKIFRHILVIPGAIWLLSMLGLPRDKLDGHLKLYKNSKNMSDQEWLSRNTDGPENPYISAQDEKDAKRLFSIIGTISQEVYFFDFRHWGVVGKMLPKFIVNFLGKHWGWHRIVRARKSAP
jgi:ubiquinone/menaquinone biosynthesis C-methylase UbiE